MPTARSTNFFDIGYQPVLKAACGAQCRQGPTISPRAGATNRSRPTGGSSIARDDIDARRYLRAERSAQGNRHRRGQGRQDGADREAARAHRRAKAWPWSRRSRRPSVPNMVWYNYRRVPAVTLHQADRRRRAGSARSSTTAPTSCRTGPSRRTCPRAAPAPGVSMSKRRAPASPATSSPTASTPRSGSTARSATCRR